MLLPSILIAVATVSAAVAVYGTMPQWALYEQGLQVIEITRRLQWPLLTLSALLCLVLAVLVITGKRRIWWLIGFAPVLALFCQQFVTGTMSHLRVVESPTFVTASEAGFLKPEEYVVGVGFNDTWYAFPYRQLYHSPVILHTDRDKRMALMWSAFANKATACVVNRQVKARELDIVSMPANALLVYNGRVGQFINGLTGLTTEGQVPTGFGAQLSTTKITWRQWQRMHPQTRVMALPTVSTALGVPVMPQYPMRVTPRLTMPADTPIVFFSTTQPIAIQSSAVRDQLVNTMLRERPALLLRDRASGRLRAFERRVGERETRFVRNPSTRRAAKGVMMLDTATNSGWNAGGVCLDGDPELVGHRLTPITNFDEDLYLGVMKEWYPDLDLIVP